MGGTELALVILMWLGIFIVGPLLLGCVVVGAVVLGNRIALRAGRAQAAEELVAEALREQPAEARGGAEAEEPAKEHVKVA